MNRQKLKILLQDRTKKDLGPVPNQTWNQYRGRHGIGSEGDLGPLFLYKLHTISQIEVQIFHGSNLRFKLLFGEINLYPMFSLTDFL